MPQIKTLHSMNPFVFTGDDGKLYQLKDNQWRVPTFYEIRFQPIDTTGGKIPATLAKSGALQPTET